jgi:tetratricopeptide (TPR) repeat protein
MPDLERQIENALALGEARILVRELISLRSGDERLAHLDRRFSALDQDSARQLDNADDLILFHVRVQGWDDAMSEAIAGFFERRSRELAQERERGFRLLGIPHPTLRDFLDNDKIAELLQASFDVAGTINHTGVRHARAQRLDFAIRHFSSAINACPVRPEPLINRGKAYLMLGRKEEALKDLELALPLSGGDTEVDALLKQHRTSPRS